LESVSDAARTLLVACTLLAIAGATFVLRLRRAEAGSHDRLIGELRAANAAAILLAATGAAGIGFTIGAETAATAALELSLALLFVGAAAAMFFRDPRGALVLAALVWPAHALLDAAHLFGWLSPEIMPRWYVIGCVLFDGYMAGLCWLARRR
jgi:hypothetical protein